MRPPSLIASRVVLFFASVFVLFSLGAFLAPPWADAHTATVTISSGGCLANGAWTATYTITPTNLENNPVATINNPASSFHHSGSWPYTTSAVVNANAGSYTISVCIVWDDGVTFDSGAVTTPRPGDCAPEAPTTTSTTTCEHAIPPIANCAGVPTTPPSTVPTPEPTTVVPPATSVPPDTSSAAPVPPETPPAAASPGRTTPPRTPAITNLPTTGSETWLLLAVAIGCLVTGAVLALTRLQRRRP